MIRIERGKIDKNTLLPLYSTIVRKENEKCIEKNGYYLIIMEKSNVHWYVKIAPRHDFGLRAHYDINDHKKTDHKNVYSKTKK